jgi:hypothetical protein
MTDHVARIRLKELTDEVARKSLDGTLTIKRMDQIEAEAEQLETQIRGYKSALRFAGSAGSAGAAESGNPPEWSLPGNGGGQPVGTRHWQLPEGQGSRLAQKKFHAPSPFDMTAQDLESLFAAGRNRMTYSTRVGETTHNKALGRRRADQQGSRR